MTDVRAARMGALVHGTICINVGSNVEADCCYDGGVKFAETSLFKIWSRE